MQTVFAVISSCSYPPKSYFSTLNRRLGNWIALELPSPVNVYMYLYNSRKQTPRYNSSCLRGQLVIRFMAAYNECSLPLPYPYSCVRDSSRIHWACIDRPSHSQERAERGSFRRIFGRVACSARAQATKRSRPRTHTPPHFPFLCRHDVPQHLYISGARQFSMPHHVPFPAPYFGHLITLPYSTYIPFRNLLIIKVVFMGPFVCGNVTISCRIAPKPWRVPLPLVPCWRGGRRVIALSPGGS